MYSINCLLQIQSGTAQACVMVRPQFFAG